MDINMSQNKLLIDDLLILQGKSLTNFNICSPFNNSILYYEYKVFSQFGEDGIIQHLIHELKLEKEEQVFIEFGVQNYEESNTRFLLMNNNWQGLVIDGDENNISHIKSQNFYWRNDLTAVQAWVDKENINQIISDNKFNGPIGILSIDVDGNDYWIWESITAVDPAIVIIEYNSLFGPIHPVTTPYNPQFRREIAHYSYLYWGGSIAAFAHMGAIKGYSLVGSNTAGNNLFFVKSERLGRLKPLNAKNAYIECRFRESRDPSGNLNFLKGKERIKEIEAMKLINVLTNEPVLIRDLQENT